MTDWHLYCYAARIMVVVLQSWLSVSLKFFLLHPHATLSVCRVHAV